MVLWLVAILFSAIAGGASAAQNETSQTLPGTMADSLLQRGATKILILKDMVAAPHCRQERVVLWIDVIEPPRGKRFPGGGLRTGGWKERWQLWRCGTLIPYLVNFIADGKGGTFIKVSVIIK